MISTINHCYWGVVDVAKKEVETPADVPSAFASRALVLGIAYAAFFITTKTFSFVCQQAGFSSLASRVALPALTSGIWAPIAVVIILPALLTLCQLIKNYYLEESTSDAGVDITDSVNQAREQIEIAINLNESGSIPENNLFYDLDQSTRFKKKKSLFEILYKKYPDYIFSYSKGEKGMAYNWEFTSIKKYASLSSDQKRGLALLMVDLKRKIQDNPDQKEIKYTCVKPTGDTVPTCLKEYFQKTHNLEFTTEGVTLTKK